MVASELQYTSENVLEERGSEVSRLSVEPHCSANYND